MQNTVFQQFINALKKGYEKLAGHTSRKRAVPALALFLLPLMLSVFLFAIEPPADFPRGIIFEVEEGATLQDVALELEERGFLRSPAVFTLSVRYLYGGDRSIQAGEYYFAYPKTPIAIAKMMGTGDYGMTPLAVTIPEGATAVETARILSGRLSDFDSNAFLKLAQPHEGYLFPDTYFFLPTASEKSIAERMRENFRKRVKALEEDINASERPLEDIVIMASLIEKEAQFSSTRRKIAGILWKRLDIGMPLQVDAVFPYILGRNTFEVTLDDLAYDSPYNTYKYAGLPPGPIANPGLDSLFAALHPLESDYLYYLADRNGRTHYSRTFEEHKEKKRLYLN